MRIKIKRDRRGGEGRRLDILMLEKEEQCTYRMVANGRVGGGRRGGRRCHGAIKIGTIIIQQGQLTAGVKIGGVRCSGSLKSVTII